MTLLRLVTASLAIVASLGADYPAMASSEVHFSQEQICKAAIGTIMGRDPKIVKVTKNENGVAFLYYIRRDDQSKWAYRCKLEGTRVIWAGDPGGRWRTDPRDEQLSYQVNGDMLTIVEKFSDGSTSAKESFRQNQLGR